MCFWILLFIFFVKVSNRHSGLDVDKIDYIARDGRRAAFQGGVGGGVNPMLLENACIAWGDCARSQSCVTCKSRKRHHLCRQRGRDKGCDIRVKVGRNSDRVGDENNEDSEKIGGQGYADVAVFRKNQHLMICYPEKMPDAIMNVFKNRLVDTTLGNERYDTYSLVILSSIFPFLLLSLVTVMQGSTTIIPSTPTGRPRQLSSWYVIYYFSLISTFVYRRLKRAMVR